MKDREFNLSKEAIIKEYTYLNDNCYLERDVKEFVELIKEVVLLKGRRALPDIDKLTGFEE